MTRRSLSQRLISPGIITLAYAAVGLTWISFSNALVQRLAPSPTVAFQWEVAKGSGYVLLTALVLYFVLRGHRRELLQRFALELRERNEQSDLLRMTLTGEQTARENAEAIAHTLEQSMRAAEETHAALMQSEARLRSTIDSALDAVITFEKNGTVVAWNPQASSTFGWSAHEAIGKELAMLVVPPSEREAHRLALTRPDSPDWMSNRRRIEVNVCRRNGEQFPAEISIVPVTSGNVTLYTAFLRDITLHTQAAQQSRYLNAIVDSSEEAIVAVDTSGRIVSGNRAAEKMFAIAAVEMRGRDVTTLFAPASEAVHTVREALAWRLRLEHLPAEYLRHDGMQLTVIFSISPIIDGDDRNLGALLVVRDVSDHVRLQERLASAERLATLGHLAATVGHEFNNVLMSIQSYVELLNRSPSPELSQRAMKQIQLSVQRGRRVTEEILHFTRASSALVLQVLPVGDWAHEVAREMQDLVGPMVPVHLELASDDFAIVADASKLAQVLTNLALNARDVMPQGGTITLQIRYIPDGHDEGWAEIRVSDTGTGMSEEVREHVFEPLFTTKHRGTGLGLAVAQEVVTRHGGTIEAESELGRGTTFTVRIRARTHVPTHEETPQTERETVARRVLLVEDDLAVAEGIAAGLTACGMTVDVVHQGTRALEATELFAPDIVLLDVGLEDISGVTVFERLAEKRPDLPVVFSTGHGDEVDLSAFLARPHVGFLRKPYTIDALLDVIEKTATKS